MTAATRPNGKPRNRLASLLGRTEAKGSSVPRLSVGAHRKKWARRLVVALIVANEIRGVLFIGAIAGEAHRQGWSAQEVAAYIQGN